MAYKNFSLYFTWIDQIVHEIITNQFTQSFISALWLNCVPLILFSQSIKGADFTKLISL